MNDTERELMQEARQQLRDYREYVLEEFQQEDDHGKADYLADLIHRIQAALEMR